MSMCTHSMITRAFLLFMSTLVSAPTWCANPVHAGYVTGVDPSKADIVEGGYDRATGQRFDWHRFDNGAEVLRALAGGDLDIANMGSSVVAVAAARRLPIETFLLASLLGTSEALVLRNGSGVKTPADLMGKTVAVPFVTTAHYSLLAALKHWNIDATRIRIVNMRVSEVPAAWQGRNIDAAYVFEPALGVIKESGIVLATSADVALWGAPTYDVWVVRSDYAAAHPEVVAAFTRAALQRMQEYRSDPQRFLGPGGNLDRIVRATGAKPSQVPLMLAGNSYPLAQEQRAQLAGTYLKALADTSAFLKSQGKIDTVLPDYRRFTTPRFVADTDAAVAVH